MKPDHDTLSAGKAPEQDLAEQLPVHPFVARLLELGPEGHSLTGDLADEPARSMHYRTPAGPASLADITPPPLPQVFLALQEAAHNPRSTPAELSAIIATDPGLTSYVLRLANSALYGPSDKVETVPRAVTRIGLDEIETMAAAALIGRLFEKPPRTDVLALPDFWQHAVAVALLSRALGKRLDAQSGERFFVAGLLHDLGRLMLAMAEPDLAATILSRAAAEGLSLDAAERLELGFDHAELGGRICAKWRLPDLLTEAVACHHAPLQCPENHQAAAVHLADFMANVLGLRATPAVALPALDVAVLARFHLEDTDPGEFVELLTQGLAAMTALFVL